MTVDWADVKHQAIQDFGELPSAETEQTLIDAFKLEPAAVLRELEAVTQDVRNGKARSGWGVWKSRVKTALTRTSIVADTSNNRAKQIRLAEAWITTTGGYIDTQTELDDELFGDRGRLREWPELRDRMHGLWTDQRPRFVTAETAATERLQRQGDTYRRLRPRKRCAYCNTIHRSDTPACKAHRSLLSEDHRHQTADLDYLDQIAPDPEETQ